MGEPAKPHQIYFFIHQSFYCGWVITDWRELHFDAQRLLQIVCKWRELAYLLGGCFFRDGGDLKDLLCVT